MMGPYQAIDLVMGKDQVAQPPVEGWVILCGTNGASMFTDEVEADAFLPFARAESNYPHAMRKERAWIHFQDVVFGEAAGRRYWTVR